jgi:pimeloyl-ACP methyl ester carboxylesterase
LVANWQDLAIRHVQVPTRVGEGPLVRVALHEAGDLSSDRILVFIHGANSDHATWRYVVGALGAEYRMVLIDLPGCGDSDKPDPATARPTAYTPDDLAERLLQALDRHLRDPDRVHRLTLIGHSLGGRIALAMLANPNLRARYATVVGAVDSMVLLAPSNVAVINPPASLQGIVRTPGLVFEFADLLGILRHQVALAIHAGADRPSRALVEEANRVHTVLRNQDTRRAAQAMLSRAVPRLPDERLDFAAIERTESQFANVQVPILILWGRRDETLPSDMGYKLARILPAAELRIVERCKHSIHIEYPQLCAAAIREWITIRLNLADHAVR